MAGPTSARSDNPWVVAAWQGLGAVLIGLACLGAAFLRGDLARLIPRRQPAPSIIGR